MNEIAALQYVRIENNEVTTTSRRIAERFNKKHKDVIRAIKNLEAGLAVVAQGADRRSFAPIEYVDERGRLQTEYSMDKMTFILLAMRFTGPEALRAQVSFVDAFETMANRLVDEGRAWRIARVESKETRKLTTEIISMFIEYAKSQGSKSASMYFMNFSKMVNDHLLEIDGPKPKSIRDKLNVVQLHSISVAENIISKSIVELISKQLPYKEIYQISKQRIASYASTVGRTRIGQSERQTMGLLA